MIASGKDGAGCAKVWPNSGAWMRTPAHSAPSPSEASFTVSICAHYRDKGLGLKASCHSANQITRTLRTLQRRHRW